MLLDIMSPYNQIPVNVKAVQIFGLPCAAYWAVLADIFPRVVQKKYDELVTSGYFTVDRKYVESRCGINPEEQIAYDKGLERTGVLAVNPDNPDMLAISMDAMFEILAEDDAKVLEKVRKKAKTKATDTAAGKRAGKISTFSAYAATLAHTPEVQDAYRLWITALVEGGKCAFSKTTVQLFHEAMTRYTSDPGTQIEILRQATASGYPNADWIINSLSKSYNTKGGARINTSQKQFIGVSEETF